MPHFFSNIPGHPITFTSLNAGYRAPRRLHTLFEAFEMSFNFNPKAREFVFNAATPAFAPAAQRNEEITDPVTAEPSAIEQISESVNNSSPLPKQDYEEENEAIDESDPLWIATLEICEGDRGKAVQMLENPDELMKYPKIKAIMEKADASDDWEAQAGESNESEPVVPVTVSTLSLNETPATIVSPQPVAIEDDGGIAEDDVVVEESDPRPHMNIVFIGHVDAGKSTLSGSILYIMGKVDARTIERYEREAKQRNRESWFLAFIMDTSEEERARGKTVEVGRAHFETEVNRYTILDAPGHKNYVPNMISGAAQADVGILVISARKGEFETGFEKGGQTREHALLAKTLGIQFLVVVINKMDDPTVKWEQARYEECVSKLKPYLKQCGFTIKRDVRFVPISALSGDNVLNEVKPEKCPWWRSLHTSGAHNTATPTLLSTLDSFIIGGRNPDGPLRVPCLDRFFERGCIVLGKVESGTLRVDDEIVIAPTKKRAKVDGIYVGDVKVRSAKPGENIHIKFNSINVEDIQKGYVLSVPGSLCPAVTDIKAHLALVNMLEHRPIFSPGYEAVLHVHTVEIEVTCTKFFYVIDNGKEIRRPFGREGQQVVVQLTFPLSTCVEKFSSMPSMGRLTLRDEGTTIAIGKILELIEK